MPDVIILPPNKGYLIAKIEVFYYGSPSGECNAIDYALTISVIFIGREVLSRSASASLSKARSKASNTTSNSPDVVG